MENKNELICALSILIIFLIMGMSALLRSLDLQLDVKPTPTGDPDQHVWFGCGAVLLFLLGLVLVLSSKGML